MGLRGVIVFAAALAGSVNAGPVEAQRRPPITRTKPAVPPQRVTTLEQQATAQPPLQMPNVEQKLLRDARFQLRFTRNIHVQYRDTKDAGFDGLVADQKPAAGTPVKVQEPVSLLVYRFVATVTSLIDVPSVIGAMQGDGEARIRSRGLGIGSVKVAYSDSYAAGVITDQHPAPDTQLNRGDPVHLVVSSGPPPSPYVPGAKPTVPPQQVPTLDHQATAQQPLRMPNVEQKLLRDARAQLRFTRNISVRYRDTSEARFDGRVADQKPAPDTPVRVQEPVFLMVYRFVATVTTTTVPYVVGDDVVTALARLKAESLRAAWEDRRAALDRTTIVSGQTPDSGTVVDRFTTVTLSLRPPLIDVPSVIGSTRDDGEVTIQSRGLSIGNVRVSYSDSYAAGVITDQRPAPPAQLNRGDPVHLIVSSGPPPVPVPDLLGLFRRDAILALQQVGLAGRVRTTPADLARDGRVVHQNPAPNTPVQRGDAVEVVVGLVPPISVPDVVGLDRMLAERTMRDSGLAPVTVVSTSVSAAVQRVVRQDPAGGAPVRPGSAVTLTVPQLAAVLPPLPPRPFVPTPPPIQPIVTDTVPPSPPQTPPVRIDTAAPTPQNPPQPLDSTSGTPVESAQRQVVDTPAVTVSPPAPQPTAAGAQQADSSITPSPPEPRPGDERTNRRAPDFWWLIPAALAAIAAAVAYSRQHSARPGQPGATPPRHVHEEVDAVADTPTVHLRVPDESIAPRLESAHDPILAYHVALVDAYAGRELDYAPDLIFNVEETSR